MTLAILAGLGEQSGGYALSVSARPLVRYDETPWETATVEGAGSAEGPWAELETFDLDPVDADPRAPITRYYTLVSDSFDDTWFRITFTGPDGEVWSSAPVEARGAWATVEDARRRSPLLRSRFPASPYDADREQDLQQAIADATDLVKALTGRTMDGTLPVELVNLGMRAVILKTEQLALSAEAGRRRSAINGQRLRSMTAGPYAESYFGPGEAAKARQLDSDPALHEVLWALATDEMRAYWTALWGGVPAPESGILEIEWMPGALGGW